ncbi:alpha/beta hydrolase family protein [Vreelandella venusta]|uniref:alpha/beta hydrolase family protein n=1 Tax=Vreelandella venusta TaxID=44935 RepID=UPI0018DA64C0|nr:alpha/beta fold hydrolase [Halomonas venusta]QPI63353.1 alpha/beta fold hydrolase [Halomonas venusta]WAM47862.1 alpha/beta fold hydrolase [Halomonas venusta]
MKILLGLMLLMLCMTDQASAQSAVGFDQTILYADSDRPLETSVWYPSQTTSPTERVADTPAFLGTDAIRGGTPLAGTFPLVVVSHGYRGNWRNQNWLATKLAQEGFIVASLDHPGTTSFDHSPLAAAQWWQRPHDLSRLLDWLLKESYLLPYIDTHNISAIGHSLGGWTVMLLAGAQFDRGQLTAACSTQENPRVCGLMPELGLNIPQADEPTGSLKDDRIKRVVSLDLGLAHSFSRQSLQSLTTPTLIMAAGVDIGDTPQEEESGFLAQYIPASQQTYIVYPYATHFSFMQRCKPGAIELIEEQTPGDGVICLDGDGYSRQELHQVIYQDILVFIGAH